MPDVRPRTAARAAALCLLTALALWFVAALVAQSWIYPMAALYGDDGLMALVSKSLAYGTGWYTFFHSPLAFDPEITTGPTLIVPAALGVRLLGNRLWVPGFAVAVINAALLAAVVWRVTRHASPGRALVFVAAVAALLPIFMAPLWAVLMGDVTTALLVALVALLLPTARRRSEFLVVGVLVGLAVLCKTYGLISLVGAFAAYLLLAALRGLDGYLHRGSAAGGGSAAPRRRLPQSLAAFAVAVALLLAGVAVSWVPWRLSREHTLASVPAEQRARLDAAQQWLFAVTGSGIAQLLTAPDKGAFLLEHLRHNQEVAVSRFAVRFPQRRFERGPQCWERLGRAMAYALAAVLLAVPLLHFVSMFALWGERRRRLLASDSYAIGVCLAGAASTHLAWYLLLGFDWDRYLVIAYLLSVIVCARLLFNVGSRRVRTALLLVLIALAVNAGTAELHDFYLFDRRPRLRGPEDVEDVVHFIETTKFDAPLSGYGWLVPREVDFRLSQQGVLKDAHRVIREELVSIGYPAKTPERPIVLYVLRKKAFWPYAAPEDVRLSALCNQVTWENASYDIRRCEVPPSATEVLQSSAAYLYRFWQ